MEQFYHGVKIYESNESQVEAEPLLQNEPLNESLVEAEHLWQDKAHEPVTIEIKNNGLCSRTC